MARYEREDRDAPTLSRRERQIMDAVYARGRATAAEIRETLPDPPSYSAVRAMLRVLEDKGHLRHERDGPRYVFHPTVPRARASATAFERLVRVFFDGSTEDAVAALIDLKRGELSDEDLVRLEAHIAKAREEGR